LLLLFAAMLAGCSGKEQMMPTPNLYAMGLKEPFTNVPPGRYYLIIAGNQPDSSSSQSSGAVQLALTGTPHM
jgi:hypothetical protein